MNKKKKAWKATSLMLRTEDHRPRKPKNRKKNCFIDFFFEKK